MTYEQLVDQLTELEQRIENAEDEGLEDVANSLNDLAGVIRQQLAELVAGE